MYNLLPLFYHLYVEVSVIWMEPVVVDSVTSVLVGEDDDLMVVVVGHMLMHLAECCDELVDVGVDDIVHHVKEAHMHLKVVAAVLVLDDLRCMVAVVEVMGNDVQLNVVVDMEHHVVHLKEDTDVEASMILVVTVEAVAAHNIDADTVVAVDRYPNMVAYLDERRLLGGSYSELMSEKSSSSSSSSVSSKSSSESENRRPRPFFDLLLLFFFFFLPFLFRAPKRDGTERTRELRRRDEITKSESESETGVPSSSSSLSSCSVSSSLGSSSSSAIRKSSSEA
ncbi:hypothetical protein BLOT_012080 [Blomia tropicalis]|nr:hypothetical protein BLOT_012080 [Blomia tropicalis]